MAWYEEVGGVVAEEIAPPPAKTHAQESPWFASVGGVVDTNEGLPTSMGKGVVRGGLESVASGIEGVGDIGALVGAENNVFQRVGRGAKEELEGGLPINPIHEDTLPVKGAKVVGQAAEQAAELLTGTKVLGTIGAAGRALTWGQRGIGYGSAFLKGADAGEDTARRYGVTDPTQRALLTLGSGFIEAGTELIGGIGPEKALSELLGGNLSEAGLRAVLKGAISEGGEEGANQVLQNLLERGAISQEQATAAGMELPAMFDGFGESALLGSVGGTVMSLPRLAASAPPRKAETPTGEPDLPETAVPPSPSIKTTLAEVAPATAAVTDSLDLDLETASTIEAGGTPGADALEGVFADTPIPQTEAVLKESGIELTPRPKETEASLGEASEVGVIEAPVAPPIIEQPTPETQTDAVQIQSPDESLLREEGPQVGLQGVEQGDQIAEQTAPEGQAQKVTRPTVAATLEKLGDSPLPTKDQIRDLSARLSIPTKENVARVGVTTTEAAEAVRFAELLGVPKAPDTWIGTMTELREQKPKVAALIDDQQAFEYQGIAHLILDRMAIRKGQNAERAIFRTLYGHEHLGHRGIAAARKARPEFQKRWNALAKQVPEEELDFLVKNGYSEFPDWRTDQDHFEGIVEEWTARKFEDIIEGDLDKAMREDTLFAKFMQWFRDLLADIMGRNPTVDELETAARAVYQDAWGALAKEPRGVAREGVRGARGVPRGSGSKDEPFANEPDAESQARPMSAEVQQSLERGTEPAKYTAVETDDLLKRGNAKVDQHGIRRIAELVSTKQGSESIGLQFTGETWQATVAAALGRAVRAQGSAKNAVERAQAVQDIRRLEQAWSQGGTTAAQALAVRGPLMDKLQFAAPVIAATKIISQQQDKIIGKHVPLDAVDAVKEADKQAQAEAVQETADALAVETDLVALGLSTIDPVLGSEIEAVLDLVRRRGEWVQELSLRGLKASKGVGGDAKAAMTTEQIRAEIAKIDKELKTRIESIKKKLNKPKKTDAEKKAEAVVDKIQETKKAPKEITDKDKLLEKDSPLLKRLMKRLKGEVSWFDLLTSPKENQLERQKQIYSRIFKHEALKDLTKEERLQLTHELDRLWQKQRQKAFQRALRKEGLLPKGTTQRGRDAIEESTPELMKWFNLNIMDSESFRDAIAPKFNIKQLSGPEVKRLRELSERAQTAKPGLPRNKALDEMFKALQDVTGVTKSELALNYWISSVLSGGRTQFDTFFAFTNGFRTMLQLSAKVATEGNWQASGKAWSIYWRDLWRGAQEGVYHVLTGDPTMLRSFSNEANMFLKEGVKGGNPYSQAERYWDEAKKNKDYKRVPPAFVMIAVQRLMRAYDHMNSLSTTASVVPLAQALNRGKYDQWQIPDAADREAAYRRAEQELFGKPATTQAEKIQARAYSEQMLEQEMPEGLLEEALEIGLTSSYQNDPAGIGGMLYHVLLGLGQKSIQAAEAVKANESVPEWAQGFVWFSAVFARALTGTQFVRFASNKVNEMLSFAPGIGLLRLYEKNGNLTPTERALIKTNNAVGTMLLAAGGMILWKLLNDGLDDEERGWRIEGSWAGVDRDKKRELMSAGRRPYTFAYKNDEGRWVNANYVQWPIAMISAMVGNMADRKRYMPDKWDEDSVPEHITNAIANGSLSFMDLSALSQLSEMFGKTAAGRDPVEGAKEWAVRFTSNFAGGFVPRALKDVDYVSDPRHNKPEQWFEHFTKEVPFYRRGVGKPMLDIFSKQIELDRTPSSRAVQWGPVEPEYQNLGKLNAKGIFIPPSDPDKRWVGKGTKRRRMTDEEASKFITEVGAMTKELVLKETPKLLGMSVDKATEFISDKMTDIREKAEKRAVRKAP